MRARTILCAAIALLVLAGMQTLPVASQGFGGPSLKVQAGLAVDRVRPGDRVDLAVVLALPADLHVNAHVPSEEYLIPTEVTFEELPALTVGEVQYPPAHERRFSFTEKPIAVYEGKVRFTTPLTVAEGTLPGKMKLSGTLKAQPCNDQSCFPPQTVTFMVPVTVAAPGEAVATANADLFAAGASATGAGGNNPPAGQDASAQTPATPRADAPRLTGFVPPAEFIQWLERGAAGESGDTSAGKLGDLLRGGNWLLALPLIYLAGLALNLTPCVYPLIPITIGFFAGQSSGGRRRAVGLASLYVLGMALMYSTLGVVAALTGQLFGSQLQNPYVLVGFALVMLALGLSMFGLWEFRLPSGLTSRVSARAGYAGALVMGLLVGFVAAPCIGPAVVALLQVVGQLGKPDVGFAIFFSLALGLGTPYLILGSVSGLMQKLPRSGEWMNAVKHIFGLVMFGMALYYLGPLMGAGVSRAALAIYTLAAGLYLLLLDRSGYTARRLFAGKRGLGAVVALAALWMLLPQSKAHTGISFSPYSEEKVSQALAEGRPVLIDFRADWCAACKELEEKTFSDPAVAQAASGIVALQKDLTRWDDPQADRLKQEYGIVGLPHVVLLHPNGGEAPQPK